MSIETDLVPDLGRQGGPVPLSHVQARFIESERVRPGEVVRNIVIAYRLVGPLRAGVLRRAFDDVLQRHTVLRTVYGHGGGEPVQRVLSHSLDVVETVVVPGARKITVEQLAKQVCAEWWESAFDLANRPPIRARLVRIDDEQHLLCMSIHHIAFDSWSLDLLRNDLRIAYEARAAGQEPEWEPIPSYQSYVQLERDRLPGWLERDVPFWRDQLRDVPDPVLPPPDIEHPKHFEDVMREHQVILPAAAVPEFVPRDARRGRRPLPLLLLSVAEALGEQFGVSRVCLGTLLSGRYDKEFENVVGCFMNPIAVPIDVAAGDEFDERLTRVNRTVLRGLQHGRTPVDELTRALKPKNRWYDVLVILHVAPPVAEVADSIEFHDVRVSPPRTGTRLVIDVDRTRGGGWMVRGKWRRNAIEDRVGIELVERIATLFRRP